MEKNKLLLHSCCGPCSTSVIERLKDEYNLTIFYYNPNIYPQEEYIKRLNEQKKYLNLAHPEIKLIDGEYNDFLKFENAFKGLELCPEGGSRCEKCMFLRLEKTAIYAKENGYNCFTTTLSVSPHKNSLLINSIGNNLSNQYNISFIESNFKKKDGFLNSIKLSKQYNLYRQTYCGCKYSKQN